VQVHSYPSSPCGQGTAPSFYRPRGGGLQSCRTVLLTSDGMVYNATERMVVLTNLASGGRRGESCARPGATSRVHCGNLLFGRHPYASSRVGLTEGWRLHNSGCGDVLSSWAPTAPGMVLQCSGWWCSGGDGRTGSMVMEETRSTGLTSRCRPVWARGRRPHPFRGFRHPLSRGAVRRPYGSGWH
jgi:hypothetical protein